MVYGLWLYNPYFMVKFAVLGKQVREKIELVSILGRKYSFVNEFSVKGEKKFVYFSNLLKTFGEFFFVKGILTCESAICINKCKQTFPRKCQFQEKGLSFSNGGSTKYQVGSEIEFLYLCLRKIEFLAFSANRVFVELPKK